MAKSKARRARTRKSRKSAVKADLSYANPGTSTGSIGHVTSQVLHNSVVGLSNPWSPHARGAKVPDNENSKSVAYTTVEHKNFTVGASGNIAVSIRPNLKNTWNVSNVINANEIVSWQASTACSDYTAYEAAFEKYRLVSWGVRIYSTLAPTDQSGTIRIITTPEGLPPNWYYTGSLFEEVVTVPLSTKDIHWVSKAIGVNARDYVAYTSGDNNWDVCNIVVNGAPADSVALTVELTMNIEAQINIGSVTSVLATPSASAQPTVMAAHTGMMSTLGNVLLSPAAEIAKLFEIKSLQHLGKVARASLPYIRAGVNAIKDNPQMAKAALQLAM